MAANDRNQPQTAMTSPPGWARDSLTKFLEDAYHNRFATFVHLPNWFRRLIRIDACFMRITKDWLNPQSIAAGFLFFRSHAAYRAACEHATSGQAAETYPELRLCLEAAGYALHIARTRGLDEIWLRRHDDNAAMEAVKKAFTIANVRSTIEKADKHTAKVFEKLYQRCVDFGGHPNERAVTGSMKIVKIEDRKHYEQIYLHGNDMALSHALKTTAQTGVCALEILQEVFKARFELLGVRREILQIRKGL